MKIRTVFLISSVLASGIASQAQQPWNLFGNNLAAATSFGSNNDFSVNFKTNNTLRATVTNAGLWGFGNTNLGSGGFAPNALVHVNSIAGQNPFRVQVAGASKLFVSSNGGVSVGSSLTPPANGLFVSANAGIGTTAPAVKLQVSGGTDAGPAGGGFIVSGIVTGANIAMDDNEIMARNNNAVSSLFINHNGGDVLINGLNGAGDVGIGTTAPANKLHVRQAIANRAIQWQHESQADFWTVGIGTNTLNCRFEFNGNLRGQISSVDGSFVSGSDLRLKDEVEPMSTLMEKVMQLKPSTYYYKDSRKIAKNKSLGFVAQDVEKIFPEAVYDMDGGFKGLNYAAFGVLAIKAIQEQQENLTDNQKQILDQQQTISELQDRIGKLEAAITALTGGSNTAEFAGISLAQNSPNPFKESTTLRYSIPSGKQGLIKIYDEAGKLVKTMNVSSNGQVRISGTEFKSGTYIYTLLVNGKPVASKKMVMLK